MRISPFARYILIGSLLAAAACRGGSSQDDQPQPDGPPNVNDATIYDIQNPDNRIPVGTTVAIKGVVVTAIDRYGERADGTRKGNIWVEEPAGGPYSGVLVFGAPADQVAAIEVGDVVDIAGAAKTEFALTGTGGDMSGRTTTELEPGDTGVLSVTKVSSGTPPAPAPVDVIAIAQLDDSGPRPTARDNEFEKWEGVLIRVENVAQVSTISTISGEANFQRFRITGGYELDTSLGPFPSSAAIDTCYASVTGVGDYFFNWKILARGDCTADPCVASDDIQSGGTGCLPQEEGDTACADGMDNDYDSFADCLDFSCQDTSPACVTDTTVSDIQMGNVTGTVNLTNVVITSLSKDGKHLWVADNVVAAPYGGVYVYRGSTATVLTSEYVVGATVNASGNVLEFDVNPAAGDTLTEVSQATVTFVAAPTGTLEPLTTATATQLGSIAEGEPFEGVLVQLSHLKITNNAAGNGKMTLVDNSGVSITVDDDIFDYDGPAGMTPPAVDTCYATFTAISSLQLIDDLRTIAPRSDGDMVVGTGCN